MLGKGKPLAEWTWAKTFWIAVVDAIVMSKVCRQDGAVVVVLMVTKFEAFVFYRSSLLTFFVSLSIFMVCFVLLSRSPRLYIGILPRASSLFDVSVWCLLQLKVWREVTFDLASIMDTSYAFRSGLTRERKPVPSHWLAGWPSP